jgi:exosortase A
MNPMIRIGVAIGAVFFWVIGWYFATAADIASIWWRSDTFAHGLLVLPMFVWLSWRNRERLYGPNLEPAPLMVVPLLGTGLVWLLGELASVASVTHVALALMLIFGLVGVLGPKLARPLAFPILFLLFGVPIGEFMLPIMMKYTALFAVGAVRLCGIPVYQEGLHFVVPNGRWSVVEACSGVRYLIASLMVGTLYAYLSYRSLKRRLIFVGFALLIPVVANWLRAFMIVLIGYFSDNRLGTGVDHLLYGWVFFGIVILLMFWIGGRWREDLDVPVPVAHVVYSAPIKRPALFARLVLLALAVAVWPLVLQHLERAESTVASAPVDIKPLGLSGQWTETSDAATTFKPSFHGFHSDSLRHYSDGKNSVSVYVATYAQQIPGRELVQSENMLLRPADSVWSKLHEGYGGDLGAGTWHSALLSGGATPLVVWSGYWINGRLVTSDYVAKGLMALEKLLGHADRSAYVAIWAAGSDEQSATSTLDAFNRSNTQGLIQMLSAVAAP